MRGKFLLLPLAIAVIYALPLIVWYSEHQTLLTAVYFDDILYSARIVDAYRGGNLASPFLAGHEQAADYMPQLSERSIAAAAHVFQVTPLAAIAACRVIFPVVIFLLLFFLARNLDIPAPLAALAGIVATLASAQWILALGWDAPFFSRYFRVVSPAAHVAWMLAAMLLLEILTRSEPFGDRPRHGLAVLTGIAVGLLFYTPLYYWSTVAACAVWFTVRAQGGARRRLLIALLVAAAMGIPYARRTFQLLDDPDVRDTLARFDLMTPGRTLDVRVLAPTALALFLGIAVFSFRSRLGRAGAFLLPFLIAIACLLLQNTVTDRHVQEYHWVNCLIPCSALAAAALSSACGSAWPRAADPRLVLVVTVMLILGAGTMAVRSCLRLDQLGPPEWNLHAVMPDTIQWLNGNTPAGSVVVASHEIATPLVLFTHNKVYWSSWAGQHTLSSAEATLRSATFEKPFTGLPYRADYYLSRTTAVSIGACMGRVLYQNLKEGTCVVSLAANR